MSYLKCHLKTVRSTATRIFKPIQNPKRKPKTAALLLTTTRRSQSAGLKILIKVVFVVLFSLSFPNPTVSEVEATEA